VESKSVGIMVPEITKASNVFLLNLSKIQASIFEKTHIVGRNIEDSGYANVYVHPVAHNDGRNIISRTIKYSLLQVFMSYKIKKLSSDVNTWIFFLGGEVLLLPILTARLLNKKVIILLAGSLEREGRFKHGACYNLLCSLKRVCCTLSTNIVVYSKSLITFCNVEKYRHKILIAHRHFLDFETFTATTPLPDRPPLIGYIGRLSGEKGVQHFTQALPAILSDRQDLRVLIGGDGQLKESIEASLQEEGVTARVDLPGWISHDDLPGYLNQLRLLVLPSYTEGLPNIMLEAMACGTPVLATPVGAIPDVIIDGKTGFIMENNSPECIGENVIRALNSPDLEQIAEDGRRFVEEHFTFEKVVENWKRVLQDIA
jgi:glycosyltransferase involved in cell wall biosynthesis